MRRKIAKDREKEVYAQAELRRNLIEAISIFFLIMLGAALVFGIAYWIAVSKGYM